MLSFSSVILKTKLYTSKLVNLIIRDPSIEIDGLNEWISSGVVKFNSSVSCGFVWVCLKSVSQFLVIESNKSSISFLGRPLPSSF